MNLPDDFAAVVNAFLDPRDQAEVDRLLAGVPLSLRQFVELAWPIIEPANPFVGGFHIDAICEHLEAVTRREIRNLLITVPPRHSKSICASVAWPTWAWTKAPELRFMFASYAADLAIEHAVLSRRVLESAWYQRRWGHLVQLTTDQNIKTHYENSRRGYRMSTSVGGSVTGRGGDHLLVDDAHNLKEIHSDVAREGVNRWYNRVWSSRLNDPKRGTRTIIMQRGHERDLAAQELAKGGYEHLSLPAEWEPTTRVWVGGIEREVPTAEVQTALGWRDPRTTPGELLCPDRFGPDEVRQAKRDLGAYDYAAQHQQRPSPAEGGIIKRTWWKLYSQPPSAFDRVIQSWDLAFKDLATSSFVVGAVWGEVGADKYLLDIVRDQLDFVGTCTAVRTLAAKWPEARLKLVEDKANGPAVISQLKHQVAGLVPITVPGSKIARAYAESPDIEAGNVYLPDPTIAPWVHDFIEEHGAFPNAAHDDQVDTTTQALYYLRTTPREDEWSIL